MNSVIVKIKNIIGNLNKNNINVLLIFGKEDSNAVSLCDETIDIFKQNNFKIDVLEQNSFKNNENILINKFQSFSMFDEHILFYVKLREKPNDFTKYIKELFEINNLNNNNFLMISAEDLIKTSSLRKYCESNEKIVVFPCYEEENSNIQTFITTKLKANNFIFNGTIIEYLLENIGNNRLIINNEIEKLVLYKNDNKNLTLNDVCQCITNTSTFNLNDLINSFASLNRVETFKLLNKAKAENMVNIIIIRPLIKYFLQLQRLKYKIDNGGNIDDAITKEFIFWKQKPIIKQHLQKWSLKNINLLLEKFINLEKNAKFNSNYIELENFILKCFIIFQS